MKDADRHFLISKRNGFDASVVRGFLHQAINERGSVEHAKKAARFVEGRVYGFMGKGLVDALEVQKQINEIDTLMQDYLWAMMSEEERAAFLGTEFPEFIDVLDADIIG